MPNRRPRVPSYRLHKASGQAVVTLGGKDLYLGPHGTDDSRRRYEQVVAEWLSNHRQTPASSSSGAAPDHALIDVNELFVAFWRHCETYYVDAAGRPARECSNIKDAVRPLVAKFGSLPVREVRPSTLKAARDAMIDAGLSRRTINDRVNRIRRMFRWGVENDLVNPTVLHGLQALSPLRRGRCGVREGKGVCPVPEASIEAVMPHLPPTLQAMVRVQQYTGMRPGELVLLRTRDLDTTGPVWTYRPRSHKSAHLGHDRTVYIGARAQASLKPYLNRDLDAYVFSPQTAMEERWAERLTHRRQPNHQRKTKRRLRERYTTASYLRAIYYACDAAFAPPAPLDRQRRADGKLESLKQRDTRLTAQEHDELKSWQREHRWHPHQLRHNAATYLRRQFGIEAARVVLGHRSAAVTEIYAEADLAKAAHIMAEVG